MQHIRKPLIAVVIATRNRPETLNRVLVGIAAQTLLPISVTICDSSDDSLASEVQDIVNKSSLKPFLILSKEKSLTRQKNVAIRHSLRIEGLDYIQILDDDTVPVIDYLAKVSALLESNSNAVGASGITVPVPAKQNVNYLRNLLNRLVGIESNKRGVITSAGIGIPVDVRASKIQKSNWLFGCSMWRVLVFQKSSYEEQFMGSCLFEDVEFSIRQRHLGDFWVDPSAHLIDLRHNESRMESENDYYRFVRNRLVVVRLLDSRLSYITFPLSTARSLIQGLLRGSRGAIQFKGTLKGLADEILKRPLV